MGIVIIPVGCCPLLQLLMKSYVPPRLQTIPLAPSPEKSSFKDPLDGAGRDGVGVGILGSGDPMADHLALKLGRVRRLHRPRGAEKRSEQIHGGAPWGEEGQPADGKPCSPRPINPLQGEPKEFSRPVLTQGPSRRSDEGGTATVWGAPRGRVSILRHRKTQRQARQASLD